jgi:hypothetical protein
MPANYIPPSDSGFSDWIQNFSTLITADPTSYGLVAGDATAIAAQNTAYQAAYSLANDPSTRTPVTVAAKDAAKATALSTVRPYAQQINLNAAVTNDQRAALGITIRKTVPTPVPPPATAPIISMLSNMPLLATLAYRDPMTPTSKAKPYGVIGVQVFASIGTVAATDPAQAIYQQTATKSPFGLAFTSAQVGKICTIFARYVTRGGPAGVQQEGPFSAPFTFSVM